MRLHADMTEIEQAQAREVRRNQIGVVVLLVLIGSTVAWACQAPSNADRWADDFNGIVTAGDPARTCAQAMLVRTAYLQEGDNAEFLKWDSISRAVCS